MRRLTCITAIQMDSERSNSRVSNERYVISNVRVCLRYYLVGIVDIVVLEKRKKDINRFLEREHSRGPRNPSEKPINHAGFNELSFFRAKSFVHV